MELSKVIKIVEEKCVNCHQCIAVCPVKFSNDGSDDVIHVNHNLCIGCGECIKGCTHEARIPVDDFEKAFNDLRAKKHKIVAIVAPAIAANYPDTYLNLNGWLKQLGVEAIFDVSFGAELTVKSYVNHIQKNKPKAVIAQPCPAIVNFIQIYKPNLLQYLAPADSPMLHTMKMIKSFYPAYKDHRILVVSPCIAKKREFEETGLGDYNITFASIEKYLNENNIQLRNFSSRDYDNDPAERAVLFSTPGGLVETAEREVKGISKKTRRIEGPTTIYHYLGHLENSIKEGTNPFLIDCLNCELGCNGGTGTGNQSASMDLMEHRVNKRREELARKYKTENDDPTAVQNLQEVIAKYWKDGIYVRTYADLSDNYLNEIKSPDNNQLQEIYLSMHKTTDEDIKNCASCGYNECKQMARAIFNGLNKKENCHFFLDHEIKEFSKGLENKVQQRTNEIIENSEELLGVVAKIKAIIT